LLHPIYSLSKLQYNCLTSPADGRIGRLIKQESVAFTLRKFHAYPSSSRLLAQGKVNYE